MALHLEASAEGVCAQSQHGERHEFTALQPQQTARVRRRGGQQRLHPQMPGQRLSLQRLAQDSGAGFGECCHLDL